MTLRRKTIIIISSTLLFMSILLFAVAQYVLLKGYNELETEDIIKTTEQLTNQLEEDLLRLQSVVGDWAPWDDTYYFIQNLNPEYVENNLLDSTLMNLDVNFMVFIDTNGFVKYFKSSGVENAVNGNWVESFQLFVDQNKKLQRDEVANETITGYTLLLNKIIMIASAPILTSKFEGPAEGTLLIGKCLDHSAVKVLEKKLKYPIEITQIPAGGLPDNLTESKPHNIINKQFTIQRHDQLFISSSFLIRDLLDTPIFTAKLTKPRTIFQQGKKSLNFFLFALSIICLVFAAVTLIFLENKVLYRLFKLSEEVKRTTLKGEFENRLSVKGEDEISSLSNCINEMLDKLWENKKTYKTLFESASDAILLLKDGKIVDCNLTALKLFDYSKDQMVEKDPCVFSPVKQPDGESSLEKCDRIMKTKYSQNDSLFEWIFLKKDSTPFETEINLTSLDLESGRHLQAIIRDVTERKRSQRTMIQAEKMLSLGGLAAGMAHEINNPLGGMMQNAQVIKNRLSNDLPANVSVANEVGTSMSVIKNYMEKRNIFKLVQSINDSGEKAAQIIQNMLSFARKDDSTKTPNNIVALLDNTIELAQTDYNLKSKYDFRQIEIIKEYESSLLNVLCHRSNIQQVFFNILKNAGEAIFYSEMKNTPPKLVLRVFKDLSNVQIEIEDNGPGISESIQKRIFEPFFTTKNPGEGTGLGLSVSYFIITEDHKGEMRVRSEVGRGTCFTIRLPLIVE